MHIATISSQRQITIPKKVLDELGVGKKDKLLLEVREGKLAVEPVKGSIVEQVSGSLAHLIPEEKKGVPFDEVMEETRKIVARKLANE